MLVPLPAPGTPQVGAQRNQETAPGPHQAAFLGEQPAMSPADKWLVQDQGVLWGALFSAKTWRPSFPQRRRWGPQGHGQERGLWRGYSQSEHQAMSLSETGLNRVAMATGEPTHGGLSADSPRAGPRALILLQAPASPQASRRRLGRKDTQVLGYRCSSEDTLAAPQALSPVRTTQGGWVKSLEGRGSGCRRP